MKQARLWQGSYRFRSLIIILAGSLGFLLGVLYLSVEDMKIGPVVLVTGPESFVPGESVAVRVAGLEKGGHGSYPVRVRSLHWVDAAGTRSELAAQSEGRRPVVVRFTVPTSASEGASLALRVQVGDEAEREVDVPVAVGLSFSLDPPLDEPPSLREGEQLRVDLWPEDGVVAYGLDNRIFVRVTDGDGLPVVAALDFAVGKNKTLKGLSDSLGLAAFSLDGGRPRYVLSVTARDAEGRVGRAKEELVPVPRGQRLRLRPRVLAPGRTLRVELNSLEDKGLLHCDVLLGHRHLDAFTLDRKGGSAATTREAPRGTGLFTIQCSPYYVSAGKAFAARHFVVAPDDAPLAALAGAVRANGPAETRYLQELAKKGSDRPRVDQERASDFLAARLQPGYVPSQRLLSTLASDEAALEHERSGLKSKLLTALALALLILLVWAVGLIGSNILDVRRRARLMHEALEGADEPPEDEVALLEDDGPAPRDLTRGFSLVHYVVFAVLAVLNIIAILWLLGAVVG